MKIWALHGGGDWADASAEYLVLPEEVDIEAEAAAWKNWYRKEYCSDLGKIKFLSFHEWLKKKGAREPSSDELEIYWEP